jgi:hypothetical protein
MKATDRFKLASWQLSKANVGNAVKSLIAPQPQLTELINSYNYRGSTVNGANGFWMFNLNGSGYDQYFSYSNNLSALKAFTDCPPVSSILMQKAHAYLNGATNITTLDGKEAKSPQANKIAALLKRPNPLQSWSQFEMQVYVNTMLYGYTVVLPIKPAGFPNIDAKQLWAIPGNMIVITESENLFFSYSNAIVKTIDKIELVYKDTRTELNVDDVFIMKDVMPSFSSIVLPQSRIQAQQKPINNIIGAFVSRGVLITNRGPRFVVSNGGKDAMGVMPMTPDEKLELQNEFKYRFGLMQNQSQAIITSATANVQTVGFDVKQLGLFEEVNDSSSMLCIGLGFPKFLAGLSDPTFNNQDTAEKALYQRFIIPESVSFYDQWNSFFSTDTYGIKLGKDYSKLPVLQEDRINLGRARAYMNQALVIEWYNNIITANEWLLANGQPAKTGFDIYYHDWVLAGKNFGVLPSGNQAPNNVSLDNNSNNQNSGNGNEQQTTGQ